MLLYNIFTDWRSEIGKGIILITSEADERDEKMLEKPLSDFVADGAALSCDDFLQNYSLKVRQNPLNIETLKLNICMKVYLWHADSLEDGKEFLVAGDKEKLQPKAEEEKPEEPAKDDVNGSSKDQAINVDDDIIEISNGSSNGSGDKKRPHDEENGNGTAAKKAR